jgi:hypothetical protein
MPILVKANPFLLPGSDRRTNTPRHSFTASTPNASPVDLQPSPAAKSTKIAQTVRLAGPTFAVMGQPDADQPARFRFSLRFPKKSARWPLPPSHATTSHATTSHATTSPPQHRTRLLSYDVT